MPSTIEQIKAYLLAEAHTPEVRALMLSLVEQVEASVEFATKDVFVRTVEVAAFRIVKGYLAPVS